MFGILKPVPFELPLTANSTWSSVVCSTCVRLGDAFGTLARFAAGPDTALLAALYEAQTEVPAPASLHYCPLRRGPARLWQRTHPGTRFAAAVSLLAASARLEDHLRDGDPLPVPRLVARRLARRWAVAAQEAAAASEFDIRPLRRQIASQRRRENRPGQPPAYYAEPTAFCFGEAFAHTARLSRRPNNIAPMRQTGFAFGEQVFLLDAVEDLAEDRRRGRFNPLAEHGTPEAAYQAAEEWFEQAQQAMEFHLAQVTMPRPEWVRPILGDSLRQIGQQRLRCASSCSRGDTCVSAKKPQANEEPQNEGRRRFINFCMTAVGTALGLICGGSSGSLCGDCGQRAGRQSSAGGPGCCCEDCQRCCSEKCCAPSCNKCCGDCCGKCCKC